MKNLSTLRSPASIAGGAVAASASIALLVRDAWTTGVTLEHILMPALVGLTVLAAHIGWQAAREWKLAALPLLALAVAGSGLIVIETMGRRAENRDTKVMTAEDNQQTRAKNAGELATLRKNMIWALPDMQTECAGAPNPFPPTGWPQCRSKRGTVSAYQERIAQLEKALEKTPIAPIDPKADRIAEVAAMLGLDKADTKKRVATLDPFLLPLFLELCSIFLFGHGLQHRAQRTVTVPRTAETLPPPAPPPADPLPPPKGGQGAHTKNQALADLLTRNASGRPFASQDEMAADWNRRKGTVSRWCSEWESRGLIARSSAGKCKVAETA